MKTVMAVLALSAAGLLACTSTFGQESKPASKLVKVGEKAPDFKMKGSDGKEYTLKQFAGKQAVVIAWFPRAFTRGCTAECTSMKDHGEDIRKFDVAYFTASVDAPEKNADFAKSLMLDFPILSDPDRTAAKAYGVAEKDTDTAQRYTFFIDKDGIVRHVEKVTSTKTHGEDIAKKLEELKVPKKKS